jgi:3-deoxy-D-manno-octulosonic-acid transferase
MLNKIYRYARIAYIGGGFGKSIHNTLEPSVYGVPVIIGPKYYKFPEAETLVNKNGFFSIRDSEGLNIIMALLQDQTVYAKAQEAIHAFFQENSGATDIIKQQVFE